MIYDLHHTSNYRLRVTTTMYNMRMPSSASVLQKLQASHCHVSKRELTQQRNK